MRLNMLLDKSVDTLKNEGVTIFIKKVFAYLNKSKSVNRDNGEALRTYMDVLFINGCFLPHPSRYRVSHQREQLFAYNMPSNEVFYEDVTVDLVKNYRIFVFFRCPITDEIEEFIRLAHYHNKVVIFDVDDLVIDTKYTDNIKYIQSMTEEDKKHYDDGVNRMKQTLCLCDAAITTTERLAQELANYVPDVFINRNVASEDMVKLSEDAIAFRDVLHLKNVNEANNKSERKLIKNANNVHAMRIASNDIRLGYFSGSITHNDDVAMILPAISKLMSEFTNLKLYICGELDVPVELSKYSDRIVASEFVDWRQLPKLIASVDINLAPIEQSIFNEAKSENKWMEAALVKVPTVASNVGAFSKAIVNGETGVLCDTVEEWYTSLKNLILDATERKRLANNAYKLVKEHYTTINTGLGIKKYLQSKMTPNIAFILPSTKISGGVLVALKHCVMLKKVGYDVLIINEDISDKNVMKDEVEFNVITRTETHIHGSFNKVVATLWSTLNFAICYPNIEKIYYLVQNFETNFYKQGDYLKFCANQTYCFEKHVRYITISKWCEDWLKIKYTQNVKYAPNGLDIDRFSPSKRSFTNKVRILIEGNSDDYYKNVDESFKIVEKLDKDKYEIWFMSYQGKPKSWYIVDQFLHRVPYEEVPQVYSQCHILIKSSILESFSYPPLEMMATGGYAVVAPNEGNIEYLRDGENCLLYEQGNIESAVECIERICSDLLLREKMYTGGIETAKKRDWNAIEEEILGLYE